MTPVVFVLTPIVAIAACVAGHVAVARMRPALPKLHGVAVGLAAGLLVVAVVALIFAGGNAAGLRAADRWGTAAAWALAYLGFSYFYVFGFFNPGESARRIRLLIELDAAGERGMTLEEILTVYNARIIVENRVQRLLSGGQARERGGRYFVGRPVMLYIAKLLVALKVVFLGSRTEFGAGRASDVPSKVVTARRSRGRC